MSLSGVRTAYTRHDTETAQRILHAVSDGHSHDQHHGGQQRELPA
jgi:hypothetical protein